MADQDGRPAGVPAAFVRYLTLPVEFGRGGATDVDDRPRHGTRSFPTAAGRRRRRGRTIAALDLGTNNCRLLIARPSADGFRVIDGFSRIVRLGQGLEATGELCETAIERTVSSPRIASRTTFRLKSGVYFRLFMTVSLV